MMIFSYLIFSCLLIIFIFYFIFIFYSDDSQYLEGYKQILNKNTFALDNLILFWIFFSRHKGINSIKLYTGRFIMFSVITNIYNKKTKGPALMELFTATGKLKKFFFWQLEMFDVCNTGDTANIDTIFKFLPHTGQLCWCACGKNLNIVSMCAVSPVLHVSNVSSCQ